MLWVTGKGSGRVHLAGLIALKPEARTRLIYRIIVHHGRKGERKGFREKDFAALLDAAHQQLSGPIVLVWDNATQHVDTAMRALIASRAWLTVYRLPPYAPDLNPTEGCTHTLSAIWATSPPAPPTNSPPWSEPGSNGCSTARTCSTVSLHRLV